MARFLTWIWVLMMLSACGGTEVTLTPPPNGGGNGGGGNGGGGGNNGSLACALTGCEIAKLAVTPTMPTGSATYAGRASFAQVDGAAITTNAALNVNANFTSRSLTLQLSQFTDGVTTYTGTAQGSASLTGAQFAGSFAGNLTSQAGLMPISGNMTGQFRGTGAVALDGDLAVTGFGGDAFGRFFANKQ